MRLAHAQAALDDDDNTKPAATTASEASESEARLGVDLRLRQVFVPRSIIELFVDKASGGSSETGFGADFIRRKGDFEVQLGIEYEAINVQPGIWIEKGKDPTNGGADHVFFRDFAWFTIEATFLNHTSFNKYVALRYGGGAGIGILKGSVNRTDSICNSPDPAQANDNTCHDAPNPNDNTPYNLPPVFPVINAIVGLQIKPTDNIVINVETGIRTLPFFGTSIGFMF
ncbi:MAG TPA: hypothetical protein VL463_33560 [Kofleriaceae bacterium]|nr:hypothetical protein [Kofleriaceae bacterium]